MKKLVQPIKWHGGKYYLRQWILDLMPPHLHYVEPFFGAGSVLLARDPARDWMQTSEGKKLPSYLKGCSEVVNDIHEELINFWRVLQNPQEFLEFQRRVELTPFSQREFEDAARMPPDADATERAIRFFIRARQSRQGLMRDFATLSRTRTRGRISDQTSAYLGAVEGLTDIHQRLQGVVILNDDACSVIRKQDGELTLFYCDPPYHHDTRSTTGEYDHEMTEAQHSELLEVLSRIEGRFLLSGYPCALYSERERRHGWNRHEKQIDNKAASGKSKEIKTECLWCNF